jgi:hypothetical protein
VAYGRDEVKHNCRIYTEQHNTNKWHQVGIRLSKTVVSTQNNTAQRKWYMVAKSLITLAVPTKNNTTQRKQAFMPMTECEHMNSSV